MGEGGFLGVTKYRGEKNQIFDDVFSWTYFKEFLLKLREEKAEGGGGVRK